MKYAQANQVEQYEWWCPTCNEYVDGYDNLSAAEEDAYEHNKEVHGLDVGF